MEDLFRVGVISSTHGIQGEVKVFPTTDDVKRYDYLKKVILINKNEKRELQIARVKYFKNMVIVKFKGIDNINDIEKYKGAELFVNREDAVPLEEDEYYIADLIDCDVYDESDLFLGKLKDVMQTAANDVYVVDLTECEKAEYRDNKEVLIPYIDDCVKSIDIDNKKIIVHLLDGLL